MLHLTYKRRFPSSQAPLIHFVLGKRSQCGLLGKAHGAEAIESLRLEKTSKIIRSNRQPIITMPSKPCPEEPYLHVFWTLPGMVTPPLPWAACSNALQLFQYRTFSWCNLRPCLCLLESFSSLGTKPTPISGALPFVCWGSPHLKPSCLTGTCHVNLLLGLCHVTLLSLEQQAVVFATFPLALLEKLKREIHKASWCQKSCSFQGILVLWYWDILLYGAVRAESR